MCKATQIVIKILIGAVLALPARNVFPATPPSQAATTESNNSSSAPPSEDPSKKVYDSSPLVLVSKEVQKETVREPINVADPQQQNIPEPTQQIVEPPQKTEEVKEKAKMLTKTESGEVGAKGVNGFAFVYEKNEKLRSSKEIWFPFETELKLTGYKSVKDIEEGDKVKVLYAEAEDKSKRVLKQITLEKKKPREEQTPEATDEPMKVGKTVE